MTNIILNLWFIVIFIPGIYFVYLNMQCIDFEKILKQGKIKEFKILYLLISICISFLVATAFTTLIQKIYEIIYNLTTLQ